MKDLPPITMMGHSRRRRLRDVLVWALPLLFFAAAGAAYYVARRM